MRSAGSSDSMGEEARDMRDLAEERVGWAKAGRELVHRRMMEGTGCFFRKELDLHFL